MQIHPKTPPRNSVPGERNTLLQALPSTQYHRVIAETSLVPLRVRQDLVEPQEQIRHVWFPQSGLLSVVNDMQDGKTQIEVGVIGREGFAGLPLLNGVDSQPCRIIVQVAGEARRMRADTFLGFVREIPEFAIVLHKFAAAAMNQASQQVACNRLHTLEQRCAKWLLTTHDHMDAAELPLTQEFLAVMLGVRRPGVTVAAQALEAAGLISYRRGRIKVTDRTRASPVPSGL